MARFILLTFAFLGWVFYEMSGGSEFDPATARLTHLTEDPLKPAVTEARAPASALDDSVTRVALNLTTVKDVLTDGTTRPARIVEPLPQANLSEAEPGALPPPRDNEVAAIIPSLVDGADATAAVQLSAGLDAVETSGGFDGDIRSVTGTRVNVRGGPSTNFEVVTSLSRGDEVEVLEDNGTGWVRMRPVDGGPVGWIADFLLTGG